jgi:NADH-quinone oxidoreductase subunit B
MARRLYEQIPDPKWVIAMGECTICGGPYYDSYAVVKGAYTVMPVDIFIPGCPVRPEALMYGFLKLNQKIKAEKAGFVTTRKGRKVSSREGRMADFTGKYTHEVPEDRR